MGQIGFYVDPKFGLGIDLCIADGMGFVEALRSEGSLPEWNADIPPELQIQRGDRIDAFKVKGSAERKLKTGREFESRISCCHFENHQTGHSFVMAKSPFGVRTKKSDCDKSLFIISNIVPSGSVSKWNEECPDKIVSSGDIIMGVDGVNGNGIEIQKMMKAGGSEFVALTILHFPS